MEDFIMKFIFGLNIVALIGLLVVIVYSTMITSKKVQKSGSYLKYKNVIYKQVNQEELDNIIVLEVK